MKKSMFQIYDQTKKNKKKLLNQNQLRVLITSSLVYHCVQGKIWFDQQGKQGRKGDLNPRSKEQWLISSKMKSQLLERTKRIRIYIDNLLTIATEILMQILLNRKNFISQDRKNRDQFKKAKQGQVKNGCTKVENIKKEM
ncbi:unnamed protein product [Paramecium sonneborni]|uniref:Uncharacterized protein n=1 Tax=Paramecium sonneborni TaxID=65129 RepID=A0A8S1RQ11_9CILI|nr:unnamed protein product [Paramecium sonneborni]